MKYEINWREEVYRSTIIEADSKADAFGKFKNGEFDSTLVAVDDRTTLSDDGEILADINEMWVLSDFKDMPKGTMFRDGNYLVEYVMAHEIGIIMVCGLNLKLYGREDITRLEKTDKIEDNSLFPKKL